LYISYSGFKLFLMCREAYWHRYVNKTKIPADNAVNALYGSIVGEIFEDFYTKKIWRRPDARQRLLTMVEPYTDREIKNRLKKGDKIDWDEKRANYDSREELLVDVREAIPRGLRSVKQHKLLGPRADAEVKLDKRVGPHQIGGRADFIFHRVAPFSDLVIIDGKGSKWRHKYIDPMQIFWYAMLFRLHDETADKAGFLYWRFEPNESIDWVDFNPEDLDKLQSDIVSALDGIQAAIDEESAEHFFRPKVGDSCRFCEYEGNCSKTRGGVDDISM